MKILPLKEVCTITMGQAPPGDSYNQKCLGLPLLAGAGDFGDIYPEPNKYTTLPGKICKPGDVILCIRATIGDRNWADREYCLGRGVAGLRAKDSLLDQNYLWHWLEIGKQQLLQEARGSTFKQVAQNAIASCQIPLPPIEEQRRIAAILDQADAVRRKRQEAIRLTDELLRTTFLDMFGDPVTNPKGWEVDTLNNFGKIVTGNTPPRLQPENFGDDIEWIKSDNITTPDHFLTKAVEGLSCQGIKLGRIVPSGSVLVACIAGSRSSIGRAAIADREVAFNQQINAIIPNSNVDTYFLYGHFFVAQYLVQKKSTDSMKGLVSKSKFSGIRFLNPPTQKQKEFGNWFVKFYEFYQNLIKGSMIAEDFFNSLLQRAFRGEL